MYHLSASQRLGTQMVSFLKTWKLNRRAQLIRASLASGRDKLKCPVQAMRIGRANSFLYHLFYLGPTGRWPPTQSTANSLTESLDWNARPSFPHPCKGPLEACSLPGFLQGSGYLDIHCPFLWLVGSMQECCPIHIRAGH